MRGLHELVDTETGEVRTVKSVPSKRGSYGAEFVTAFHRGLDRLAGSDMTPRDYQVLVWLLTRRRLQWVGYGPVHASELAHEIGCSQPTVSRSLDRLCGVGVLERQNRGGGGGQAARYRLNPWYFWRGTNLQYWQAVRERGKKPRPKEGDDSVSDAGSSSESAAASAEEGEG